MVRCPLRRCYGPHMCAHTCVATARSDDITVPRAMPAPCSQVSCRSSFAAEGEGQGCRPLLCRRLNAVQVLFIWHHEADKQVYQWGALRAALGKGSSIVQTWLGPLTGITHAAS